MERRLCSAFHLKTSALVTLVTAENNRSQGSFKRTKVSEVHLATSSRLSGQRDKKPDSRTCYRQRGTVRRFRLADRRRRRRGAASEAGMTWSARYRAARYNGEFCFSFHQLVILVVVFVLVLRTFYISSDVINSGVANECQDVLFSIQIAAWKWSDLRRCFIIKVSKWV